MPKKKKKGVDSLSRCNTVKVDPRAEATVSKPSESQPPHIKVMDGRGPRCPTYQIRTDEFTDQPVTDFPKILHHWPTCNPITVGPTSNFSLYLGSCSRPTPCFRGAHTRCCDVIFSFFNSLFSYSLLMNAICSIIYFQNYHSTPTESLLIGRSFSTLWANWLTRKSQLLLMRNFKFW